MPEHKYGSSNWPIYGDGSRPKGFVPPAVVSTALKNEETPAQKVKKTVKRAAKSVKKTAKKAVSARKTAKKKAKRK